MIKILTAPSILALAYQVDRLLAEGWTIAKALMVQKRRLPTWYVILRKEV